MHQMTIEDFKSLPSARLPGAEGYLPPTKRELKALLAAMNWSHYAVHLMLGVSFTRGARGSYSSTVNGWLKGDPDETCRIPAASWVLLLAFAGVVEVPKLRDDLSTLIG